ncbi:hypothetical protein ACO1L6_14300, partial [Staphylococcus aureus]
MHFHGARALTLVAVLLLAACDGGTPRVPDHTQEAGPFPAADRPVAKISSPRWSTEEDRDRLNEAGEVMTKAGIKPG